MESVSTLPTCDIAFGSMDDDVATLIQLATMLPNTNAVLDAMNTNIMLETSTMIGLCLIFQSKNSNPLSHQHGCEPKLKKMTPMNSTAKTFTAIVQQMI